MSIGSVVDQESLFYFFDPSAVDGDKIDIFINNQPIKSIDLTSELNTQPFKVAEYSIIGNNTLKIKATSTGESGNCTFAYYIEKNQDIIVYGFYELVLDEEISLDYEYSPSSPIPTPTSTRTPTPTVSISNTPTDKHTICNTHMH